VSQYQKGKTNLDFTEARDNEWQWHQPGRMQVCTSLQRDNHISTPLLSFLQAGCPPCRPTNSVKALKVDNKHDVNHKTGSTYRTVMPPREGLSHGQKGNTTHRNAPPEENRATARCRMREKFGHVFPEACERTDRQTDRHAHRNTLRHRVDD